MNENTVVEMFETPSRDALWEIAMQGAREMLQAALVAERAEFLAGHSELRTADGSPRITGNGFHQARAIQTGLGGIKVKVPRTRDREPGEEPLVFRSSLVPPYLRRSQSVEELLPVLYLHGISTGRFGEALAAILGPDAPGLSASSICRLKSHWEEEYEDWTKRPLANRYVYFWADAIYSRVRSDDDKLCLLVIIGATQDGKKELIGLESGYAEDKTSWLRLIRDLQRRGLSEGPQLATGDGALGFWAALAESYPETKCQRCWKHKIANVLSRLPKSRHAEAKSDLHQIFLAATKGEANGAFDAFIDTWSLKYAKAAECLDKDRDALMAFYDFPAEHWIHLRTTNPIESTFATIRLRTRRTRGCLSRKTMLTMVFKLAQSAASRWRRLNGHQLFADVITGVRFTDGIKTIEAAA